MEENKFLNKPVKVVLVSGFILYGTLIDIDQYGVTIETKQETSYQGFSNIREIRLDNGV